MRSLRQRVETTTTARLHDAAYLSTVMLLDYWVGQLLDFLSIQTDLRCGKPMSETTLVIYQSENGNRAP